MNRQPLILLGNQKLFSRDVAGPICVGVAGLLTAAPTNFCGERGKISVDWFWLAVVAYWIGHVISVMEMRAERPGWRLLPCAIIALRWPYLVVRRAIAVFRRGGTSQW